MPSQLRADSRLSFNVQHLCAVQVMFCTEKFATGVNALPTACRQ